MTTPVHASVVITGAGLVCAIGRDKNEAWQGIVQGGTGIRPLTALEQATQSGEGGGEIPADFFSQSLEHGLPREVMTLRAAIAEALNEAGFADASALAPRRCGMILGTTLGGMRSAGDFLRTGDHEHLRTFLAGSTLDLAAVGLPELRLATTTCAACASGLYAIALGATLLQCGELDVVIAGGYDPIGEYAYAGFKSLRLVADGSPKPFSTQRAGMSLGEGCGIVILEREDDARRRGTKPIVRLLGWGESSDVHHLTQPHPEGRGAVQAIEGALAAADCSSKAIDLICAHATATPANDAAEFLAYQRVFGEALPDVPVVAFKSHIGHTLGGAGAIELVLATMAMRNQIVPPTAGTSSEYLEFGSLNLITKGPREAVVKCAMITSMGFGGANACAILGSIDETKSPIPVTVQIRQSVPIPGSGGGSEPVVTGVGVVLPDCIGNDAFVARLRDRNGWPRLEDAEPIAEEAIEHLLNVRRARRISQFAKMMLAATTTATRDAGIEDVQDWAARANAVLGTTHGAAQYSEDYYRQIVQEGLGAANPMLFAEGVPNVASAHLSLMLGIRGGAQTIVGTRTAGLDALGFAARRIRLGAWDRAIVGAGEEVTPLMIKAYRACGQHAKAEPSMPFAGENGFVCGCGAVVLALESLEAAMRRGARILAFVDSAESRHFDRDDLAARIRATAELIDRSGPLDGLVCSANGTWIDRIESLAINQVSASNRRDVPLAFTSLVGHIGETFSVGSLAGIAAVILTGRLPDSPCASAASVSDGDSTVSRFGVLCSDITGASLACLSREPARGIA